MNYTHRLSGVCLGKGFTIQAANYFQRRLAGSAKSRNHTTYKTTYLAISRCSTKSALSSPSRNI